MARIETATPTRRSFLLSSLAALGASACSTAASRGRIFGANERVRLGFVGLNGRGSELLAMFRSCKHASIDAVCDVDSAVLDRVATACGKLGEAPRRFSDAAAMMESGAIDAVVIASPNHWHTLHGVMAMERGLDVYVEKPVSHDVWEGAQLVAAAQRHRRVAACGTQCRSHRGVQDAIAFAQSGQLGAIRLARGLCYKRRKSIGKANGAQRPPASVDYDRWLGPAPMQDVRRLQFHYDWHWQRDFGNGDLGNQGVHQMDLCRMAVGLDALPNRVMSIGGRLGYDDDGDTPNTQLVLCESDRAPILFEVRGLPSRSGSEEMDAFLGARIGLVLHCERGDVVITSYYGGYAQDEGKQRIAAFEGRGDHCANFIEAVRHADSAMLAADVRQGHLSAALCHLGEASLRAGKAHSLANCGEAISSEPMLALEWERMAAHLRDNGVPSDAAVQVGAALLPTADASRHPRRDYRAGYELLDGGVTR